MSLNAVIPDVLADLGLGHIKLNSVLSHAVPVFGSEYGPAEGGRPLREAIAAWEGVAVEEVAVTTGASLGLVAVMATLPRPCSVLCPRPHYPAYPKVASMLGLEVLYYDLEEAEGWQPDPQQIARLLRADTRALLWNFPNNPTGSLPSAGLPEEVASLTRWADLLVISDEVYADLIYDGTSFPDTREVFGNSAAVRLRSFSKLFGMPGERLGYVVADPARARAVTQAHWALAMSSPATAQAIALKILQTEPGRRVAELREALAANRDCATQILAGCHRAKLLVPPAGIFCWIQIRDCPLDSRTLARACAEEVGVIVTPGAAFGVDSVAYLRASFAVSKDEVMRGFAALSSFLNRL